MTHRGPRTQRRAVFLGLTAAVVALGALAVLVPPLFQREDTGAAERHSGTERVGLDTHPRPHLLGVGSAGVATAGARSDVEIEGPGIVVHAMKMDGEPGAVVSGASCLWFDGTGARGSAETDGRGKVSLAECTWPVIGVARAPGLAETLFWVESPPPNEGFLSVVLEPVGSLRVTQSGSTLLDLKDLDPRCDPVWHEEQDPGALSNREFQVLTWAALRTGLSQALESGGRADATSLLGLHTQVRAQVDQVESENPRSALWALPMRLAPEWTTGGVVWRGMPARLAWVWSVSKPLGTPLPPLRDEFAGEHASGLVLPPRLEGRTHSHALRVPPGGERVLQLEGSAVSVVWLTVPPPVGGDGRTVGPPQGLLVHSLVERRSDGRITALRALNRKAPDAMGIVRLDNVPPGEHMLLARWQSGPAEVSLGRYLVTLVGGEARDLGPLAPGWHTSVEVAVALVDAGGAELPPEDVFVDPGSVRYWLQVPVHSSLGSRDFTSMQVPIAFGEPVRIVGIAPSKSPYPLSMGPTRTKWTPFPSIGTHCCPTGDSPPC